MKIKEFFEQFFLWASPIATVLGMVLLGLYSSRGDIGNAMWSGMLITFGWGGALASGYFSGEREVMRKIRKNAERFHKILKGLDK